ncbi:MAG: hypothetical protein AAFR96_02915 [Planctomycetota bacterium]
MLSDLPRVSGMLLICGASLALAPSAAAQDGGSEPAAAAESLPDGFAVLEAYVEALGGEEQGMKMQSLRMEGAFSMPAMQINGTMTIDAAAPASQLVTITIPGMGNIVQGTDGEKAWANQMPGQEPQVVSGEQAESLKSNAAFHARYQPRTRYTSATNSGIEQIDGEPHYAVELVDEAGTASVSYFNVETGLQRLQKTRLEPGSDMFVQETAMLDYEEFGGLLFPTRMLIKGGGFEQEITFEAIEIDPEVKPGTFDAPGSL